MLIQTFIMAPSWSIVSSLSEEHVIMEPEEVEEEEDLHFIAFLREDIPSHGLSVSPQKTKVRAPHWQNPL